MSDVLLGWGTYLSSSSESLSNFQAKVSVPHHCWLLQVSWCKLEVKLSSAKMVTAGCANRQHPPPLVVAALNLKTTLGAQASPNLTKSGVSSHPSRLPLSSLPVNHCQVLPGFELLPSGGYYACPSPR